MKKNARRLLIISTTIFLCLFFAGRFATMQTDENELLPPLPAPASGIQKQVRIAKGSNSTLAVWSDNRTSIARAAEYYSEGQGGGFDIYAARFDANGGLIDTVPIVINEQIGDQLIPSVEWNGQNWLIVWTSPPINNYQAKDVVGVRVSPDGVILDATPIVIGTQAVSGDTFYTDVASDGTNWVVTWTGGFYESKIRSARVAPDGTVLDAGGGGKILFDDAGLFTAPNNPHIAYAGGQFLLVWSGLGGSSSGNRVRAKRFDQNLNPIDASPFTVNQLSGSSGNRPDVETDGTNFLVAWHEERFPYDEIFAARVSAGGQVLDPNGIKLYGPPANYSQGSISVGFNGANYAVAFHSRAVSGESIFVSLVSPAGTILTPNPTLVSGVASLQTAIAPLPTGDFQVVWEDRRLGTETNVLGQYNNGDIFGAKVLADGTANPVAPVAMGAPRETFPRIVFTTGGNFASVFQSNSSGVGEIYFQRFAADGNPIDANPFAVVSGSDKIKNPSVAWNGSSYLVVWEINTQIYGRRVAPDGSFLGAEFFIMPGNQPDVAALGTTFLVVDDYEPTDHIRFTQAVRVDGNGAVLGSPVKIGSNFDVRPRVRAFGNRWLAVWESDATHDNRVSIIVGAFVNQDGTTSGEFVISSGGSDTPGLAIAGNTALIAWERSGDIYGRRIQADGTLLDTSQGILLASGDHSLYAPAAAWDGSRFLVTYNDSRNRNFEPPDDVWATLVGLDGSVLTPGGFPVSKLPTPEQHATVEAQNGKAVFGYALFDDKKPFANYRVKLRKFPFDQDYFVTSTPYSRQIAPGEMTTYEIGVTAVNGFNGQVNLGIENLSNGITATFNPSVLTGGGTSVLTLTTAPDVPENLYRFNVTATSGTQQSNTEIVLFLDDDPPPQGFNPVNLGTLGGLESEARAINENGQIVGFSRNSSGNQRAFLYNNGQMTDLGTLGGADSIAYGINDSGAIVGKAKNSSGKFRAFLLNNGGQMLDLGTINGAESEARSINNTGQITGTSDFGGSYAAFLYQNGQMENIGSLGLYTYGNAINSAGKITGASYTNGANAGLKAYIYQNGTMTSLGTIAGRQSLGNAINDNDEIAGSSETNPNQILFHAFKYSNGQMRDLGTLGGSQSYGYGINSAGQIVGAIELTLYGRDYRAFFYDGTTMRNLNTLIPPDSGWTLNEAFDINNSGQIVGRGTLNNQVRAFLLNPVGSQNQPPTIQITSPTANRNFGEPSAITINATAFDADGAVVRVEFYADGNLIGTSNSNPYAILWSGMAGNRTYTLTAKAFDDRGASTTSAPVRITIGTTQIVRQTPFDFDGDRKTDISIFRPSNGEWWYLNSSDGGNAAVQFGNSQDKLVPSDFTGDGKTDIAFWRPSTGEWFILRSENVSYYSFPFGTNGDIPFAGDFDADGKSDPGVFRPSNSTWYILKSGGGIAIQQFGLTSDFPVVADYDGDGKSDIAVFRPAQAEWWILRSTDGLIAYQFGNPNDKPVQGDFTGDGKADAAFWRPSSGEWFVLRSEDQSFYAFPLGSAGDVPAPGDYDGDGKFDAAIFRPSTNIWYIQRTTTGMLIQLFGQAGDKPVPNAFVP